MTAPASLASRILLRLAGHHAQKPARAEQVLELVGGPEEEFYAALDELAATCQINSATVKRFDDAAPWRAIWPTGVIRPMPLTGARLSGLFVPHTPLRQVVREVSGPKLRAETAPAVAAPTPPATKPEPKPELKPAAKPEPVEAPAATKRHKRAGRPRELIKAEIVGLLTGLTRANAIKKRDLAIALGATGVNPLATYCPHINEVVARHGWIGTTDFKTRTARGAAFYDTRTEVCAAPAPAPVGSMANPVVMSAGESLRPHLEAGALVIDGPLGRLHFSPADTERLRAVLAEARP